MLDPKEAMFAVNSYVQLLTKIPEKIRFESINLDYRVAMLKKTKKEEFVVNIGMLACLRSLIN